MPDATTLREQLAGIPTGPGVYIYRDAADRVLYVGKAKSLRRRVLSYFQAPLRPDEGVHAARRDAGALRAPPEDRRAWSSGSPASRSSSPRPRARR